MTSKAPSAADDRLTLSRIDALSIPNTPQPPPLSDALIREMTAIVFGEPGIAQPCDIIFIFGGSHPGLWITAAEAYHAGLGPHIIATGGYKATAVRHHSWQHGARPEAHVIRDELVARGVPDAHITVEDRSTNSLENVLFAQEVYDFSSLTSILTICRSYGAGRQCRTLRRHIAPHIVVYPYTFDTNVGYDGVAITHENWMTMADGRAGVFGHLLKIIKYARSGDIEPLEQLSDQLLAVVNEWLESQPLDSSS